MGYLIDTDILIDYLKGKDFAIELLSEIWQKDKCFISILTYYELLIGAYSKKQLQIIEEFVKLMNIIDIDLLIVETAADFYKKYRKKGITLPDIDCLIMATAKVKDLKIVTRNVRHYPEIELLSDFSKQFLK